MEVEENGKEKEKNIMWTDHDKINKPL